MHTVQSFIQCCTGTLLNCLISTSNNNKSPLPLTDPRDAVAQAYHVVHRCQWSV